MFRVHDLHVVIVNPQIRKLFSFSCNYDRVVSCSFQVRTEETVSLRLAHSPSRRRLRNHSIPVSSSRPHRTAQRTGNENQWIIWAERICSRFGIVHEEAD